MKAVLISIRPKWCEKIISGEKTIEVRKTRPKMYRPFKCYIYCTKDKHLAFMQNASGTNLHERGNGNSGRRLLGEWQGYRGIFVR